MKIVYNVAIRVLYYSLFIVQYFSPRIKNWLKAHAYQAKILESIPAPRPSIWFHCASHGEFEMALPLIRQIKSHNPESFIITSFFSASGFKHANTRELVDQVIWSPVDLRSKVRLFVNTLNPKLVVFMKNELWFNLLWELERKKIPFVFMTPHFSGHNFWFRYRKIVPLISVLKKANFIFLSDKAGLHMLDNLGFKNLLLARDPKIDQAYSRKKNKRHFPIIAAFCGKEKVIICGSIHKEDEKVFLPLCKHYKEFRFILVPHDPDLYHPVDKLRELGPEEILVYSSLEWNLNYDQRILLVDKVGILADIYQYGLLAYVGGGFGQGIHNILEPFIYGIPVMVGPNFEKFPEALELIGKGVVHPVKDEQTALDSLKYAVSEAGIEKVKKVSVDYFESRRGGTNKIFSILHSQKLI